MNFDCRYQEKGVKEEVQLYMKQCMIKALQNKHQRKVKTSCLSTQSLNWLVAEHCIKNNYHYTLSVLQSEAPLSHPLPTVSPDTTSDEALKIDVSQDVVKDILECFHLNPEGEYETSVLKMYAESTESLLKCLLKCQPTSNGITRVFPSINDIKKSKTNKFTP